jgi:hypothetical protein
MSGEGAEARRAFVSRKLNWVDRQRPNRHLRDYDFRVLHAVVSLMDARTGEARVSQDAIAAAAGKGKRRVQDALLNLRECGALNIRTGVGRGNISVYRLGDETTHINASFVGDRTEHKRRMPATEKAHDKGGNDAHVCALNTCSHEGITKKGGLRPPPSSEPVESQRSTRAEARSSFPSVRPPIKPLDDDIPFDDIEPQTPRSR